MSLLLDALRRASASREDPKGEHFTMPHRGAQPEAPPAGPTATDAGRGPDADEPSRSPRDELAESSAELEGAQGRPSAFDHRHDSAAPEAPTGPSPQERETADALLEAGAPGAGRGRLALVLGLAAAALIALTAVAGGGWLWYQESRQQIAVELGRYQPAAVPSEPTSQPPQQAQPTNAESIPALAEAAVTPEAATPRPSGGDTPPDDAPPNAAGASSTFEGAGSTSEPIAEAPSASSDPPDAPAPTEQTGAAPESDAGANASDHVEAPVVTPETAASDGAAVAEPARASSGDGGNAAPETRGDMDNAGSAATAGSGETPSHPPDGATPSSSPPPADGAATPRKARPLVQDARGAPLTEALRIGYGALNEDNIATAETAYNRALDLAPDNRDALLGSALVRQRQGAPDAARRLYQRVLDAHPRDPYAWAALAALDGGANRRHESALKMLLRDDPTAPALNYALGNLYARESRWADARQAYARASEAAPEDPDYAYNLAVALDHLGRAGTARAHYLRALRLSEGTVPEFRPGAVRRRVGQLR